MPSTKRKKTKEETIVLNNKPYHNSVGCNHYWIQKTGTTVECKNCGLGLFGARANGGKLVI